MINHDILALLHKNKTDDILFGHSFELYCEGGSTVEKRKSLLDAAIDYTESLQGRITHYHPRNSSRLKRISDSDWVEYYRNIAETVTADDVEGFDATVYGFDGGKEQDAATPYFCCVIGSPEYKRYSRMNAYYPMDWFGTREINAAHYIERMRDWCSLLNVSHGTAGFSLILEEGTPKDRAIRLAFPFLKRFPGLDLPYSSRWSSGTRRAKKRFIRTINWLTATDHAFISELGGLGYIQGAVGEECPIHDYDGGIIIQAGPYPEIGDSNKGITPQHYITVGKLLEPLIFDDFNQKQPYIYAPTPLDSHEESVKWVHRFAR
ncbi:type VI immunity family protein [Rhizobium oryziradicis]|uniref:DUF3396 domain-containing protein n=1 Tax=Rhizobium oryziradicis TaxID=1867956 RepID=A0A1Q8ZSH3_9HYPH|nr:type VI immunity family protein [Rhizobium oryziradicis]OLP45041.1 hypothetical protein BJF95_16890 [Rhizobium oryziradicis]